MKTIKPWPGFRWLVYYVFWVRNVIYWRFTPRPPMDGFKELEGLGLLEHCDGVWKINDLGVRVCDELYRASKVPRFSFLATALHIAYQAKRNPGPSGTGQVGYL